MPIKFKSEEDFVQELRIYIKYAKLSEKVPNEQQWNDILGALKEVHTPEEVTSFDKIIDFGINVYVPLADKASTLKDTITKHLRDNGESSGER